MRVIAEAGLNWANFENCIDYIHKAKQIGVDIIKFQIVENENLPQLTFGEWKVIKEKCDKIGIEFSATPSSKRILDFLISIDCRIIKIGSDRANQEELYKNLNRLVLVSDGWYNNYNVNMYCVSLYPCDKKYIDFEKMSHQKYIGFSDHTKEYDKEWVYKIPKNIHFFEKHFTLYNDCIDKEVSLGWLQFEQLVQNIRERK